MQALEAELNIQEVFYQSRHIELEKLESGFRIGIYSTPFFRILSAEAKLKRDNCCRIWKASTSLKVIKIHSDKADKDNELQSQFIRISKHESKSNLK